MPRRWVARHPNWKGQIIGWDDTGDPFVRLRFLLAASSSPGWPLNRWKVAMDDLECPKCRNTNPPKTATPMIQLRESPQGLVIECDYCGSGVLLASAASAPAWSVGPKVPT